MNHTCFAQTQISIATILSTQLTFEPPEKSQPNPWISQVQMRQAKISMTKVLRKQLKFEPLQQKVKHNWQSKQNKLHLLQKQTINILQRIITKSSLHNSQHPGNNNNNNNNFKKCLTYQNWRKYESFSRKKATERLSFWDDSDDKIIR